MIMKERKLDNVLEVLLPSLFLSFTFFIFGPIEIYMTNISDFWFQLNRFLPINLILFFISWIALTMLEVLFKSNSIFTNAIFGVAFAMYIQGNWMLFIDYGEMDGTTINWNAYGSWPYVNLIIWIILILVPIIASFKISNKKLFNKITLGISLLILGMQCVTLVTLGLTTDLSKDQDYYVAKDKYMLDFSKEKNIVVMLFDAFQSSYFQQAIEDIPEAQEIFENFVFFDNATGTSLFSEEGSATILTGNQLRPDLTFSENIDYIYSESSFLPELKKQNFDVRYYMQTKMVSGSADKIIKNIVKEGQETDISYPIFQMMNRITSFCYMPHIIKQYFWFSYQDVEELKKISKDNNGRTEFVAADHVFNQEILNGKMTSKSNQKTYRMYYFKGVHPPYNLDVNGDLIEYNGETAVIDYVEDIHDNQMIYQQTIGSIRIMENFIRALKDEGIYDQTDIIITADHGWENRYNPILLMKTKDTVGDFRVSHAPVSYVSDFVPTIRSVINESYQEEKTVFDYTEEEERARRFYIYFVNKSDRSYYGRDTYVTFSNKVIPSEFYRFWDKEDALYHIGDKITFTYENDGRRYFSFGISNIETDSAWTSGKSSQINLNIGIGRLKKNLTGEFQFKSIFAEPQRLVIRSNGRILYDSEVMSVEEPIKFLIPKDSIQDGWLTLDLEYPNAISPFDYTNGNKQDTRLLAFRFSSIRFYEDQ